MLTDLYDVWHYCPKRGFRKHNVLYSGPLSFAAATDAARWINGLGAAFAPAIVTKARPC